MIVDHLSCRHRESFLPHSLLTVPKPSFFKKYNLITVTMASTNDMEKQPLLASQPEAEEEPSLSDLQANVRQAQRAYFRAWSRTTSGKWHKRIMFSVTAFLILLMVFCTGVIISDSLWDDDEGYYYRSKKVPLEAHIMSKCPDAKDCLHDMILPSMQNISDKVDFRLSYIGT
jgi:hypothetical protein